MIRKDIIKKYRWVSRRILACAMAGCMAFGFAGNVSVPAVYAAETEEVTKVGVYTDDQGIKYELYDDGTCKVCGYTGKEITEITILDKVKYDGEEYSVTSIGNDAFDGCSSLTGITIPEGVTSIGAGAFDGCSSLTDITIPESVTDIGRSAFYGCSNLTSITIPEGVTSIGMGVFGRCSSLTSITVDEKNQAYKSIDDVLYTKSGDSIICCLTKKAGAYVIPSGVTSIGDYAFDGCSDLTGITIPEGVTSIGMGAFFECSSLTSIIIPESVTFIDAEAFYGCSGLTSINIPEGITSIYATTFYGCSSLTGITLPSSIREITYGAFMSCSSLTNITIPSGATTIWLYAFDGCSNLTSITIPSSVTEIASSAFKECSNLVIYGESGSTAETYAKENNIPFVATNAGTTPPPADTNTPPADTSTQTTYKIIYQLNGGKNNTKNPSEYTTSEDVKLYAPKRAGYAFKGWYTTKNFKASSKVTTISKDTKSTVTLYAKWEKVKKPAKVSLKKVKSTKAGTLSVTTKKGKSVAGYQFIVSTNKKFKKNVKKITTKKLTTTFKGLKKGKTYYVKVRAYRVDSANNKVYGSYSGVKTVTIKK